MPPDSPISREAFELLREAYSETEAWKVARLATALMAGGYYVDDGKAEAAKSCVSLARVILGEARRQVAANPARLP